MHKLFVIALLGASASALAKPLLLPEINIEQQQRVHYRCDTGQHLSVNYLNGANGQSFAVLPIDTKPHLLVATLAASGVRYAAEHSIWWAKGNSGDLYNLQKTEDDPTYLIHCQIEP